MELVVVVQHVQVDVRADSRPSFHRLRIDRGVVPALEDLNGLGQGGVEGVVLA